VILFWVALAWLAGGSAAALGLAPLWPLVMLGGAGSCLGLLLGRQQGQALLLGALVLAALVAIDRYEQARPDPRPAGVALLNGEKQVHLRGIVVEEPEERERSQRLVLQVEAYQHEDSWVETHGKVLVNARLFPRFDYGDVLEFRGALEAPPVFEGFDYREYLARRGISSVSVFPAIERVGAGAGDALKRAVIDLRAPFSEALRRSMQEPESALARGILLGQRASIPAELNEDFNRAGISHLIAISGYNVMLVAGFALATLGPLLGRRRATVAAMLLVLLYAGFVGGAPSVLRATLMAEVMLGATLAGRPGSSLTAVLLTGAALTAWRPLLIEDVSFQLSFAATLGIVLLSEPLRERIQPPLQRLLPEHPAAFLAEQSAVTTAASFAVLPVIASSFGRLSLVSLVANVLAVWGFTLSLAGAFVTAVAGAVHDDAGRFAGELAHLPLAYLVLLGRIAAGVPMASVEVGDFGLSEAVVLSALLLLLTRVLRRPRTADPDLPASPRLRPATYAALVMVLLAVVVAWGALAPAETRLRVTMLDVGQGDAILIETAAGHLILVDGGPSGARLTQALGRELAPSQRRIDLMVLTHGHDDHTTGLIEVL
jgi:competence protein ComEC